MPERGSAGPTQNRSVMYVIVQAAAEAAEAAAAAAAAADVRVPHIVSSSSHFELHLQHHRHLELHVVRRVSVSFVLLLASWLTRRLLMESVWASELPHPNTTTCEDCLRSGAPHQHQHCYGQPAHRAELPTNQPTWRCGCVQPGLSFSSNSHISGHAMRQEA